MIYVIGKNGFVGSAICSYFKKEGIDYVEISRQNYSNYVGDEIDCLINANGSGLKGKANEDPRLDFEKNVKSTLDFVFDFKYRIFIHISSIDVYSDTDSLEKTRENSPIEITKLCSYGFDKYLAELIVKKYCPKWLILRLGGLVGQNLKKNPIYDWTHGKPFLISAKSKLTFIHTETVAKIISQLIDKKVTNKIINVCSSDSIKLTDLASIYDFEIGELSTKYELSIQNYNINISELNKYFQVGTSREYIEKYLRENHLVKKSR